MVNALAGVIGQEESRLDARDTAARGMIGSIDQQEFSRGMEKERMDLERARLAAAERSSNMQGLGALAGQFGPDLIEELKRLRTPKNSREEFIPSASSRATAENRGLQPVEDFDFRPTPDTEPDFSGFLQERLNNPLGDSAVTGGGDDALTQQQFAVSIVPRTKASELSFQYPSASEGFITPPFGNGVRYKKTSSGWQRL
jgi:hypothetical protein